MLGLFVRLVWFVPSAFITQTSLFPPSLGARSNAILVPSGDHSGWSMSSPVGPTVVRPVPSMLMIFRLAPASKTIFRPSGDHPSAPVVLLATPAVLGISVGLDPSASITQTAALPPRSLVNAIFVPSADQAGE